MGPMLHEIWLGRVFFLVIGFFINVLGSRSCIYAGSTNASTSGRILPPVAFGPVSPLGGSSVYPLSFSGLSQITGNATGVFCVTKDFANTDQLQHWLDWACGKGQANCSAIQPGQPCYLPNTVKSHAAYAFNDYYQRMHRVGGTCNFSGTATTTTVDPSSGSCIYTGSTNGSTNGGFMPPVAFGPVSPLGGSTNLPVSRIQLVIQAAFLALFLI